MKDLFENVGIDDILLFFFWERQNYTKNYEHKPDNYYTKNTAIQSLMMLTYYLNYNYKNVIVDVQHISFPNLKA